MQVVGMVGHARHGKDSVAQFGAPYGYKRYAFADNVRRALYALDPLVAITPRADEEYARLVPRASRVGLGLVIGLRSLVDTIGWDDAKSHVNVRQYLQRMGTEAVRDVVAYDAWIMALKKQLDRERPDRAIVTDVRFPNERDAIKSWGGTIVRVVRLNEDGSQYVKPGLDLTHPSEAFVDELEVDVEIACRTIEELRARAEEFFELRAGAMEFFGSAAR